MLEEFNGTKEEKIFMLNVMEALKGKYLLREEAILLHRLNDGDSF